MAKRKWYPVKLDGEEVARFTGAGDAFAYAKALAARPLTLADKTQVEYLGSCGRWTQAAH